MIEVRRILLDNDVFADTQFTIKPGISVIYGLNRTSKFSKNSNGVGKTSLLSAVPAVLYGSRMNGFRGLDIRASGKNISIEYENNKLEVYEGNEKLPYRTIADKRAFIEKVVPINELEFFATSYLNIRRLSTLITGSSSERRQFFEKFFGVTVLNEEKKAVTAIYKDLMAKSARYESLLSENPDPADDIQREVKRLQAERDNLLAESKEVAADHERITSILEARRLCSANKDLVERYFKHENLSVADAEQKLNQLLNKLDAVAEYESYRKAAERFKAAVHALPKSIVDRIYDQGFEAVKASVSEKQKSLQQLRVNLAHAKGKLRDVAKPKVKVPKPEGNYEDLLGEVSALRTQISHYRDIGDTCPTCGAHVDVDVKALTRKYDAKRELLAEHTNYREYEKQLKEWEAAQDINDSLEETIALLAEQVADLTYYENLDLSMQKPAKVEDPGYSREELRDAVDDAREVLEAVRFGNKNRKAIDLYDKTYDEDIPKDYVGQVSAVQEALLAVELKLSKAQAQYEVTVRVDAEITRLEQELKILPDIQLLLQAYEDKAVKRLAIKSLTASLMDAINQLAGTYMPEDFRFEFVWDEKEVSLLVHRHYPGLKKPKTTDINMLSGAEATLFAAILIPVMNSFLHENHRLNCLFMDEPTANMSEDMKERFKKIVVFMNKVIPSIIITTPNLNESYENAINFTVVKKGGKSHLVDCHPTEVE